ncbi:MAG: NAD+ synthase [Anaerolineaceae bacterium]|nr:NAD+ synthase [Anaerolineaceae bacterium]
MNNLDINTDLTVETICSFIHNQTTQAGFSKAVIGVSGGVDSALSCFLTARALGGKNVLAVRMPYKTSSQASLDHAQLVIDKTGAQSMTIPITDIADGLINQFPEMSKIRRGNIMARSRMIVLYDRSAAFNGLVVGTGNKTEILLGYSTLYGDSACAFNPIGDLYKAQVRQLARALGVPDVIIDKAPSADLWAGQTDEDELGFTYAEVDQLLYLLVDERHTPDECIQAGFKKKFVATVVKRILHFHFKRVMPPIAKVTSHAVSYDFPHLRGWGI